MITISTILYYTVYAILTGVLSLFFGAIILDGFLQLRSWAKGEEDPQVPQKKFFETRRRDPHLKTLPDYEHKRTIR